MIPEPVTPPENDTGRRAQSIYDLEATLVRFIERLLTPYRLDNPTLNLAQPSGEPVPAHPIAVDPDTIVTYDPDERATTLMLKVAPRVVRGRVPRTVTGEIDAEKLPDCPAVIVQAVAAKIETDCTHATVKILVSAYDENPDGGGYQDVQNISEAIWMALTSFGQQAIDKAYPIVMPIEWKLTEAELFPHYVAELITNWELPSARPLPDSETFGIVPMEHADVQAVGTSAELPARFQPPPGRTFEETL